MDLMKLSLEITWSRDHVSDPLSCDWKSVKPVLWGQIPLFG